MVVGPGPGVVGRRAESSPTAAAVDGEHSSSGPRSAQRRHQADANAPLAFQPPGIDTDPSLRSVLAALLANTLIAIAKGVAAALTGSAALLAETLHTVADAGNEVFLYVAIRRSAREPDATHPLGYAPERYYWALIAAIGMFAIGGAVRAARSPGGRSASRRANAG
jgi:Co/Zn/Cd efflux system component